ncbi:Ig domain-containing protein [Nonomuraea fuscirosea]|uniref:Ig domain-containing protein n=1 Tax=Nonomuraea fuscirosea TaxID=1291556 RepID=UPI00389A9B5B
MDADQAGPAGGGERGLEAQPEPHPVPGAVDHHHLAPQATPGSAYRQTLAAKSGVPFCDWQVTGGSLPAGLALDRFTGAITGTPTAAGTSAFTVQLRDYDRLSTPASRTFTLTIGAGGGANLAAAATPSPGSGWCCRAARRRSGCCSEGVRLRGSEDVLRLPEDVFKRLGGLVRRLREPGPRRRAGPARSSRPTSPAGTPRPPPSCL